MDKKEFRNKLEELAIIKDKTLPPATKTAKKRIVQIEDEFGELIEVVEIEPRENKTLGFDLIAIKHQPKVCELGCGKIVEGQVIQTHFSQWPVNHRRVKCLICNKYQHPSGEGLIANGHSTSAVYTCWYKVKR